MTPGDRSSRHVDARDVGFGVVCLLSVSLILPVQLVSMIVFDSTGLDVFFPPLVFMSLVPALVLSSIPALLAYRQYGANAARLTLAFVFLVAALAGAYLVQFYGLCGGPGC